MSVRWYLVKGAGRTILNPFIEIVSILCQLAERRDGAVAVIFGLAAIPIIIAAGMATDTARAYMVKTRLAAALDAAALAVGSETNQTSAQLTTDLKNYFYNNYCKAVPSGSSVTQCSDTVANETSVTVQPITDITASVVTYQAQATVPMVFMQLAGVNNITVSTTAQTTKFPGMEIAVVLDNTGSMLCGPNDGAPNYQDSTCAGSVVASDTTCTNASNQSRICTLIKAATQFVNTLVGAETGPQQLYMSIVPYVTTVNVANAFGCTNGGISCTHMTSSSCGGFTDQRGNIIPVIPISGTTTSGSATISSISPNTSAIQAGMQIAGPGIPSGATVSSISSSTQITISSNATLSYAGNSLTLGPTVAISTPITATTVTGTWTNGSNSITSIPTTANVVAGMRISSGSSGIPVNAYVTAVNSLTQITISANATASKVAGTLTLTNSGGNTTNLSNIVTKISAPVTPTVGMVIAGNGIPPNTTITSVDTAAPTFTSGTGQVHICNNATATNNTALAFYTPIAYDSTFNTTSPTTTKWGGCVIEPTSSGENSAVAGVINAAVANPDTSEPAGSWPSWYPFWWASSNSNSWATPGPSSQNNKTSNEVQGAVIAHYDQVVGPNEGCPVPLLPLTDLTDSTGQTTVQNTINSMWPRDAGGTQVHIGMIWGWRVLSPNSPFAANNGHPLDYATTSSTGWKKIIVLMTDGTEEWPVSGDYTGLGALSDGKIGTTSSTTTAQTNLNTRLQSVCDNIKASSYNGTPNYVIYTIGLGSDGASNTQLQSCAANGGFFRAATPTNLTQVFQDIANSIVHLRLTK
jgi:Flp pilus assembly protein TadG